MIALIMLNRVAPRLKTCLRSCCILVSLSLCHTQGFVPEVAYSQNSNKTAPQKQQPPPEWSKSEVEGIPYKVALTSVNGELGKPGSRQVMFLFLEANLFSEDRVLRIFRHIHFQVPNPTTLYVTLLTDRALMVERLHNRNWESSLDDNYSRLTDQPQHCCPHSFKGAQFERYVSKSLVLVCDEGKAKEIVLEH